MSERLKLQVIEVKEAQPIGTQGVKKLVFKAKSPDNKELWYFTFRPSLFEHIKKDVVIDAEVEIKIRDTEGRTYTDRQLNQLFIDGEPIGGQKKGWRPQRDSPEQRQSIERQVSIKCACEIASESDTLEQILTKAERIAQWIARERIGTEPSPPVQTEGTTIPKPQPASPGQKIKPVSEKLNTPAPLDSQRADLFQFVADKKGWKGTRFVRSWLVSTCKIPDKLITENPAEVLKLLKVDFPEWFS